jgi:prephenate dehydrogenase
LENVLEKIAIIGLTPKSLSAGIALENANLKNTRIVGMDIRRNINKQVKKLKCIPEVTDSYSKAVMDSNLVIIDVPVSSMRDTLQAISSGLPKNSVVVDFCSSKSLVMNWAREILPNSRNFIGGHPLIKSLPESLDDADPNIFLDSIFCLIPDPEANPESVKLVTGLAELLGSKTMFIDAIEHDSFMSAVEYLPILLSAAFVAATSKSNSWRDMHKLTTSNYTISSKLSDTDPRESEAMLLSNSEEMIRWIDAIIAELYKFRGSIYDKSDELFEYLINSWEEHAKWEANAVDIRTPETTLPGQGRFIASSFFGEYLTNRYRSPTKDDDKNDSKEWKYKGRGLRS